MPLNTTRFLVVSLNNQFVNRVVKFKARRGIVFL